MRTRNSITSWLWKIPACALAFALGSVLGGFIVHALSLEMPRMPGDFDPKEMGILLVPAGAVFALGLAAMARGLAGRWWERWAVLGLFLFAINGIGNSIEASLFTTLGGGVGAAVAFVLPSVLCALAVAILFPAPADTTLTEQAAEFLGGWKSSALAFRIALGILAFAVVYFFFGMLVAPIVTPYYASMDFLLIPPMTTLIPVLLGRSTLILLVTLPVVLGWAGSRNGLIVGLALGNATAVGLGGLVQAAFFPAVLRWTHGIEILADGIAYAWILALLFVPRSRKSEIARDLDAEHPTPQTTT